MALFISLVMLLILTILGISSIQSTTMQERMARNARDSNLAFQAAESAIKDAEVFMETLSTLTPFTTGGTNGHYDVSVSAANIVETIDWSVGPVADPGVVTEIQGVNAQPTYIVEFLKTVVSDADRLNLDNIGQDTGSGRTQMFRVTAYGTGGSSAAHVVIQSTYGKRF
jgi:type IV pilus assembly protein PilX